MKRNVFERELKNVGVTMQGWDPVFRCDACGKRWQPFNQPGEPTAPTARLDYWKCPNKCNDEAEPSRAMSVITPRYVLQNDIPGVVFGDEDLKDFEQFVRSMDATEISNTADS
jgi:hypothetical protein